jgi:hypothetical protein
VARQIEDIFAIAREECFHVSAKTGAGVPDVLEALWRASRRRNRKPGELRALVFDSEYDTFRGGIIYVRMFDGAIRAATASDGGPQGLRSAGSRLVQSQAPADDALQADSGLFPRQHQGHGGNPDRRHGDGARNRRSTRCRFQGHASDGLHRPVPIDADDYES